MSSASGHMDRMTEMEDFFVLFFIRNFFGLFVDMATACVMIKYMFS